MLHSNRMHRGAVAVLLAFALVGASCSRDPDEGDSIRFAWDFDNDGTVDSIDPAPTHTYTANGVYTARLTVTDAGGRTDLLRGRTHHGFVERVFAAPE